MNSPDIFREYDIRGVVDKDYDSAFAKDLGKAFATYLRNNKIPQPWTVSVGIDARLSGPALADALCSGLMESGAHVVRLGVITTPLSYFSTFSMPLSGAIMVTGSHNPPDYNGFKVSLRNSTIFGEEIQKLRQIIEKRDFITGATPGTSKDLTIFESYINKFAPTFSIKNCPKVVVDCGNVRDPVR
jgi:phosphomannomutase/phosphomannomutase/phosphoglucomutase